MEITVNNKKYDSGLVTFGTALKAIELEEKIVARQKIMIDGNDEEVLAELEKINLIKEYQNNAKLLIEFFDNQFTYEEFQKGFKCESLQSFNETIMQMIGECKFGIVEGFGNPKDTEKKK